MSYVNYLIPGIAVQTVLFSAGVTGFALADDLQKGFIYRLRSLPMARSAVFGGRVAADTVNNTLGLLVLIATGFAVGFRPANVPGLVLAGLLLCALAVSLGYARGHQRRPLAHPRRLRHRGPAGPVVRRRRHGIPGAAVAGLDRRHRAAVRGALHPQVPQPALTSARPQGWRYALRGPSGPVLRRDGGSDLVDLIAITLVGTYPIG